MIEDKRRTTATDFDDERETLKHSAPLDMGAMLGDDDLDRLCDAVISDLDREPTAVQND